eukprot:3788974-Lingulodinium_polyedra.AAC.1
MSTSPPAKNVPSMRCSSSSRAWRKFASSAPRPQTPANISGRAHSSTHGRSWCWRTEAQRL